MTTSRPDVYAAPQLWQLMDWIIHNGKRLIRIVTGAVLVGVGIALLVLPGPGSLVIILGLSLLAVDFVWARRTMDRLKQAGKRVAHKITGKGGGSTT